MVKYFIHRPIFAIVIALVIIIAGTVAIFTLPIAQYPPISPPTITVETFYVGASARVVEENVAVPIEQEVNGAENMIYMSSSSTSDGRYALTCTFAVGTDIDIAQVDVQNRVNRAGRALPPEVINFGITVQKASPDMLIVLSLFSPDSTYDDLFLSNYASLNLYDPIARIYGVGNISIVGEREYAMRLWVRPDRLAALGLTARDVAQAVQDQNVQAAAGQVGQPPAKPGLSFQYTVNVKGRLTDTEEFDNIIIRTLPDGSVLRLRDVASTDLGARRYTSFARRAGKPATTMVIYQLPGANALDVANKIRAFMARGPKKFSAGPGIRGLLRQHLVRQGRAQGSGVHPVQGTGSGNAGGVNFPGEPQGHIDSLPGSARTHDRHFCRVCGPGVFHQLPLLVRPGPGHRLRGGRRHRGGGGGQDSHGAGLESSGGHRKGHGRSYQADTWSGLRPPLGLCPGGFSGGHYRPTLPAVRSHPLLCRSPLDHCGPDRDPSLMRQDPASQEGPAGTPGGLQPGIRPSLRPHHPEVTSMA